MTIKKNFKHSVTINDKRRKNKKKVDLSSKTISKDDLNQVFNSYYRNQVRALYDVVVRGE